MEKTPELKITLVKNTLNTLKRYKENCINNKKEFADSEHILFAIDREISVLDFTIDLLTRDLEEN